MMITVKQLIQTTDAISPDNKHWEPALSMQSRTLKERFADAKAVWQGKATAIRQTNKEDLMKKEKMNESFGRN